MEVYDPIAEEILTEKVTTEVGNNKIGKIKRLRF